MKMPVAVEPNVEEQLKAIRAKKQAEQEARDKQKKGWHGLVYCEGEYASIGDFDGRGIWLGKTNEIIPYLKKRGIDGENIDTVLLAVDDFRSEQKNHSCHSTTKTNTINGSIPTEKSIVATFKGNPHFLRLLESLVAQDKGIRTIHSELKKAGYVIPMRTLGRWIAQIRQERLL
jgi:hypothetical protein